MLGWHISVYRQRDGGGSAAQAHSPEGARIAVWQTGPGGLDWLNELVKVRKAICLGGNGYPVQYTALAKHVVPLIAEKPPGAHDIWICDLGSVLTRQWEGRTVVDRAVAAQCDRGEWLLIEAWDES
jgi:hypothetical protein